MQSNYLQLKQHYIPPNSVNKPPFFSLGIFVQPDIHPHLSSEVPAKKMQPLHLVPWDITWA